MSLPKHLFYSVNLLVAVVVYACAKYGLPYPYDVARLLEIKWK